MIDVLKTIYARPAIIAAILLTLFFGISYSAVFAYFSVPEEQEIAFNFNPPERAKFSGLVLDIPDIPELSNVHVPDIRDVPDVNYMLEIFHFYESSVQHISSYIPRISIKPRSALRLPELPSLPELPQIAIPVPQISLRFDIDMTSKISGLYESFPVLNFKPLELQDLRTSKIYLQDFDLGITILPQFKMLYAEFEEMYHSAFEALPKPEDPEPEIVHVITEKLAPQLEKAEEIFATEPAAGASNEDPVNDPSKGFLYDFETPEISVNTVLTPQKSTVISSSRDGKINKINFENGDLFRKGDVLLEYDCRDIEAEFLARESVESLSAKKSLRSEKLFKLDIISSIENLELGTETKRAKAEREAIQQRLDSCKIRADYDGRVTNLLANPGEYTRTDRVLMEVSSLDALEAEFLLPSIWLRWMNVDAPLKIKIHETGRVYDAVVRRIHGEIDAASRSIQMTAKLVGYDDPLLPGMSGEALIDLREVRENGVKGYLELGDPGLE